MYKGRVLWYCGHKSCSMTGVGNYSTMYINKLKSLGYDIRDSWIMSNNTIGRILLQFVIRPISIVLFHQRGKKIFWDESMLIYTFFPFFPYKSSIFIIHDIRDFNLTASNKTILQRIYFKLLNLSTRNINKLNKIIVPSEFTKRVLINKLGVNSNKITVINNSFNLSIFKHISNNNYKNSLLNKYGIPKGKYILNVGSEEDRKNVITILKVMKKLDGYTFIKIGKPMINKNRDKHKRFIQENNLEKKVIFLDYLEDVNDLVGFYNVADLFLFPSLFEGFGRPPIEAQACGCPVMSSSNGSLREVLGDSCIYLDNPEDVNEIINKIKDFTYDEGLINKGYKNAKKYDINRTTVCRQHLLDGKA